MRRTLRSLGYDASLRVLPDGRHFEALTIRASAPDRRYAVVRRLPGALGIPPSFSCAALTRGSPANLNPSQFCDRETDRLMAAAGRVQAIDPSAADALWARAERRIVDLAPAVAAYNLISADLVSERVGNYQYSPAYGVLLDQFWVR